MSKATAAASVFGIDVETKHKANLIRRLRGLKSTISVEDRGQYREDLAYSKIHVATTKSEGELDVWCWETKGIDYIGVYEVEPELA